MNNNRTISLPAELCHAAEQKYSHRFGSLEEFVSAVLTKLVCDDALEMDAQEQRIIEERLRALGYV